jgi:hypothetical protein
VMISERALPGTLDDGWELVSARNGDFCKVPVRLDRTERMEVPGGWIYRTVEYQHTDGSSDTVAMCFVPDPFHPTR